MELGLYQYPKLVADPESWPDTPATLQCDNGDALAHGWAVRILWLDQGT